MELLLLDTFLWASLTFVHNMRSISYASRLLAALASVTLTAAKPLSVLEARGSHKHIKPKVFLIDMFPPEGAVWYGIPEFNVLARNISVPGISPLYPDVHCTENGDVCQIVTGEAGM